MNSQSQLRRNATIVAAAGILAATLGTGVATAAPAGTTSTIRIIETNPSTVKESNSTFQCPANNVLVGREHHGDENGNTTYYCARILIDGYLVTINAGPWTDPKKESSSSFTAPVDEVVIGRSHAGDENGNTQYRTAYLTWQGKELSLLNTHTVGPYQESNSLSKAGAGELLVGRSHSGDENGSTYYQYATLSAD